MKKELRSRDEAATNRGEAPGSEKPLSSPYKDSDFLRQTAERAMRSQAYRQSQDLGTGAAASLPAFSGRSSPEKERPDVASLTRSRPANEQPSNTSPTKESEASSTSNLAATRSPLPLTPSQRFDANASRETSPTRTDGQPFRATAMSPTQARMTMGLEPRSTSPTKGLGGFVQSAMMKRADSLSRRDSARGNRPLSVGKAASIFEKSEAEAAHDVQPPRSSSPEKSSYLRREPTLEAPSSKAPGSINSPEGGMLPNRPRSSDRKTAQEERMKPPSRDSAKPAPPAEKPFESNKSTLESKSSPSLDKPSSVKPSIGPNARPSWMEELSKKKAARESDGSNRPGSASNPRSGHSPQVSNATAKGLALGASSQKAESASKLATPDSPSAASRPSSLTAKDSPGTPKGTLTSNKPGPTETSRGKPEPPPKLDFRSNLKSRQGVGEKATTEEPEFKNAFGKLRKAETKNFVAPDELKNNILRGKAGLALTGGPKKSERRDEFKESILKKKEEMKAGAGSVTEGSSSTTSKDTFKPKDAAATVPSKPLKPLNKPTQAPSSESVVPTKQPKKQSNPIAPKKPELTKSISNDAATPTSSKPVEAAKVLPIKSATAPIAAKEMRPEPKGSLADRFNPALANIIGRGPSPGNDLGSPKVGSSESSTRRPKDGAEDAGKGGLLTHATKSRARGPKRRLPATASTATQPKSSPSARQETFAPGNEKKRDLPPSKSISARLPTSPSIMEDSKANFEAPKPATSSIAEPRVLPKPPSPSLVGEKPSMAAKKEPTMAPAVAAKPELIATATESKPSVSNARSSAVTKPEASSKPKTFTSESTALNVSLRSPPMTPKSPNILSKSVAPMPSSLQQEPQNKGLAVSDASSKSDSSRSASSPESSRRGQKPPRSPRVPPKDNDKLVQSPKSPPVPTKDNDKLSSSPKSPPVPFKDSDKLARVVSNTSLSSKTQPSGLGIETESRETKMISEFFKDAHNVPFNIELNTQAILSSKDESSGKIKTLRKEMFQIDGDGKRSSMPPHQEHILFENNMYLCTHTFSNESGKRTTEVYLWYGDGVSSSAVEDAQLFGRNAARDAGGKLVILSQGKESSNFFEALGGIVVVRQGRAASASAAFVLRGRRHLGQIAFDEVALTPQSLCSGFPHIVAAPAGPLYLWKGRGCNADEVGCARLIGMDLGPTGEIAEVDEGREPAGFWKAFGSNDRPDTPAAHWARKAATDRYRTRLFAVGDARPKSASSFLWNRLPGTPTEGSGAAAGIRELAPYSQADLARDGLYVLDTYFELFM